MRTRYINDLFSQIKNGRLVVVANIEHPTKRTIVEAAGGQQDPAYPSDGMSLLKTFAGAAPVSRRLYWRYKFNQQRAMRDGDMKYLKVRDNTFLFNVVNDPLERANWKAREPEVFKRMEQSWEEWETTMLPIDPLSSSSGNGPAQNPDRPGNTPPAPGAAGPGQGKQLKGKGKQ